MISMTRDSKGRFNGWKPDAETMKRIDDDNLRAERFITAFKEIGIGAKQVQEFGLVRQWKLGHKTIAFRAEWMLFGAALGLAASSRKGARAKRDRMKALAAIADAFGWPNV